MGHREEHPDHYDEHGRLLYDPHLIESNEIRQINRLKERLRHQTLATQNAAKVWHDRVWEKIKHHSDESHKDQHPIDQIVGTVIRELDLEAEQLRSRLGAWEHAMDTIRDSVLHCRYQLAETVMETSPELVNAVLGIIDDNTPD